MDFARPANRPIRLYRGSSYVVTKRYLKDTDPGPVVYDHEGFPARWYVPQPPQPMIGFDPSRIKSREHGQS
jgi:hypothetical protein